MSTVTSERRLYIFPHTGGSADFYVPFARAFTTYSLEMVSSMSARIIRVNREPDRFFVAVEFIK